MDLLYRVENTEGTLEEGTNGAYRLMKDGSSLTSYLIDGSYYDDERHPLPNNDPNFTRFFGNTTDMVSLKHYRFGFNSLDQLKDWFYVNKDYVVNVHNKGLGKISVYEVKGDGIVRGRGQCLCNVNDMTLVQTLTLVEVI